MVHGTTDGTSIHSIYIMRAPGKESNEKARTATRRATGPSPRMRKNKKVMPDNVLHFLS